MSSGQPTKRRLLQGLAQTFDPLGIITPVLIRSKMLLQRLWKDKVDWDTVLTGEYLIAYQNFVRELSLCDKVCVPRAFNSDSKRKVVRTEIHMYCESSMDAYGCVAYLRKAYADGESESMFNLAKARVAPIKTGWTIPRLELLGAVLAARLLNKIRTSLGFEVDQTICHCDNMAVLAWVKERPGRWKTFVANRVSEIQALTPNVNWVYVRSQNNPADLLSRGCDLSSAKHAALWLSGDAVPEAADAERAPDAEDEAAVDRERRQEVIFSALCVNNDDALMY